jgi:hypothetical protein
LARRGGPEAGRAFDKIAVAETKRLIDDSARIPNEEFGSALSAYFRTADGR